VIPEEERLGRYAELAVRIGANLQPGQILTISSEPGKEPLARAIAVLQSSGSSRLCRRLWRRRIPACITHETADVGYSCNRERERSTRNKRYDHSSRAMGFTWSLGPFTQR